MQAKDRQPDAIAAINGETGLVLRSQPRTIDPSAAAWAADPLMLGCLVSYGSLAREASYVVPPPRGAKAPSPNGTWVGPRSTSILKFYSVCLAMSQFGNEPV